MAPACPAMHIDDTFWLVPAKKVFPSHVLKQINSKESDTSMWFRLPLPLQAAPKSPLKKTPVSWLSWPSQWTGRSLESVPPNLRRGNFGQKWNWNDFSLEDVNFHHSEIPSNFKAASSLSKEWMCKCPLMNLTGIGFERRIQIESYRNRNFGFILNDLLLIG